jgi:hypothetical protein
MNSTSSCSMAKHLSIQAFKYLNVSSPWNNFRLPGGLLAPTLSLLRLLPLPAALVLALLAPWLDAAQPKNDVKRCVWLSRPGRAARHLFSSIAHQLLFLLLLLLLLPGDAQLGQALLIDVYLTPKIMI